MKRTREEERELARFYEQYMDDPALWGEPVEPPTAERRQGLSVTITVRFSPDEAARIRETARNRGTSYSGLVREAVHAYTQPRPT